ncbi:hypothetical protein P0M11_12910 [Kaistella sp. PBT33-4]|uniref:DUF304 domain-containing protein n=1 Tax=Kaistella pullorum TaxID=2763074 RepID=A0ABR8WQI6_9FLAO|nr:MULTISPECIES: hypothetical protein [Kaistella]MBD8019153.1 hypothetical protein [Kaistella pullorum]MDF0720899.1 hypothetical protein [Kaistella sp. PBT33-4]
MEKIQLHSKLTFIRKYIIPIWMIFVGSFILYSTIIEKNWIALIIVALVLNGMIYTIRKFLFPLKNVFLDKENKKIIVEYRNEIVEIPVTEIVEVDEQSRLGKIINVKLNSKMNFGSEFIFVPKNKNVFREIMELRR